MSPATGSTTSSRASVVALAATRGEGRSLVPLMALVSAGHRVVSWHRHAGAPVDVVLASDPQVLASLGLAATGEGGPAVACRVRSVEDFAAAAELGVAVTFTDVAALAAPDGPLGQVEPMLVPARGIDLDRYPAIAPLARSRIRRARQIPDPLVLAVDSSAPEATSSTSLALASAAVVDEVLVPVALALGTPTVVSQGVASRFGLTDGVEAVVVGADQSSDVLDRAASALALDEARCAALSHRARRFSERHLDLSAPARSLRRALGLEPEPSLLDLRLEELSTPISSRLRERANHALDLFTLEPSR